MASYPYARPYVSRALIPLIKACAAKDQSTPFDWLEAAIKEKAERDWPTVYESLLDRRA